MAQAKTDDTLSFPHVDTPAAHLALFMEGELSNVKAMARLAEITVQGVVGDTLFEDGEVIGHHLTVESVDRVMFVIVHLAEMVEALGQKFCGAATSAHTEH